MVFPPIPAQNPLQHLLLPTTQGEPLGMQLAHLQLPPPLTEPQPAPELHPAAQSKHRQPLEPQAFMAVPATHWPCWQQPPWQGWSVEQAVTHWWVERLHAVCGGQSLDQGS